MAQLSSTQIYGNLSVDGKTLLNGALNLADNVTIDKDLTVNGSTHLKTTSTEKLTVNGSLIANGDINANSHQVTAATFVGNLSGNATSATFLQADSRQSNPDLAIKTSGVNYCVLSGYSLTTDNATADSSVISSSDAILLSLPWSGSTTYGAQLMFDDTSEGKLWVRTKNSSWGKWARIFTTAGGKIAGATTFLEKITASKGGTFEGDVSMTKLTVNGGVTVNGDINANSHQVTAGTFVGNLTGNADTSSSASKLTTDAGNATTPVYFSKGIPTALKSFKNNVGQGPLGWTSASNDNMAITSNTLAYWDGNWSTGQSNLKYCSRGLFGSIVTKNIEDYSESSHNHDDRYYTESEIDTKINDIEIGGRNLVLDTIKERSYLYKDDDYARYYAPGKKALPIQKGEYMTVSFECKTSNGTDHLYLSALSDDLTNTRVRLIQDLTPTKEWKRYIVTTKRGSEGEWYGILISGRKSNWPTNTGDLYIRNIKVEKGNKATDWTPAPEDMLIYTNGVLAKHENGYYGLALSDGSDPGYFRTPKNGLIPWSSSNGGYLGTSGWQFSEGYIKNIHSTSVTATTFTENGTNLSDKYLALSGGTMTGAINLPYNEKSLEFSRGEYSSGIFYGTSGNENLSFINEWKDASFSFVTNSNPDSWTSSTWHASTTIPDLQIKKKSIYINKLIGNGVEPKYNLYVNGTSYVADTLKVDKRLTANGKISVPTTGVSWVSGMNLDNCAIGISTQNAGGAYFPVIGGKTVKGNVWNIGSIYDTFGVYGFKVGRTEDSTDWSFTWNTENGAVSSTGSITAPTLTGTDITTNNLTTTGSTTIASLRVDGEADFNNIVTVNNNLTVAEGELTVTKGNLIVSEGNISATKGTISATTFEGDLNGNASTATKADNATQAESATKATEAESLTTKAVGSKSEPIYWEGGKPVKCDPIEVIDEKVKQVVFNADGYPAKFWRPLVISTSPGGDFVGETFISGDLLADLPGGALKSKANVTNNSYINENLTLIRQSRFEQYGTGRIGCFWIG